MTMTLMQLKTHWNADEAETIIDFLDDLRNVILTVYDQEIKEAKQKRTDGQDHYNHENIDDRSFFYAWYFLDYQRHRS